MSLFGGVAMWPLAARAQKPDRVRRIGLQMAFTASDAERLHRARTIAQELQVWVGQTVIVLESTIVGLEATSSR